ncbi:MAG: hypothetical protein D9V44_06120 [Actinobacteria bacterium]|nr:MAG: hypothetical protein D9V44_06120 [Actinomycetota bacterium]
MKRLASAFLAVILVTSLLGTAGCKQRTVTVKTGEIVLCTAGEVVEDKTTDMKVPEKDVAKYSVTTRIITCPDHQNVGSLYDEAQKALAAGDLKTAADKLKAVLALNPGYKNASSQLNEINGGKKPTPDTTGGSTGSTTTPTPDEPTDAVSNLVKYVPDTIAGYSAQGIIADPASITRNYIPTSGNADQLVIFAEQTVDAKGAQATLDTLKQSYPTSGAAVKVGTKSGYFGIRDSFAVVIFIDGPVVVSVELHAKTGKAADLKDAAMKVAAALAG